MFKLLMVDDEKWVREQFANGVQWEEAGFVFMGAASSGKEALAMIERDPPHLLLTDITMPGMDGLQLAAIVKERWPQVHVIILTAYSEFEYAQQAIAIGVDNYLVKVAQSGDAIVKACRKAAELIASEMNKEEQLQLQEQLNWRQYWNEKRVWLEQAKERLQGERNEKADLPASMACLTAYSHIAVLILGWDLHRLNRKRAIAVGEAEKLQQGVGGAIEEILDKDGGIVVPYLDNRVIVYVGADSRISSEDGERKLRTLGLKCLHRVPDITDTDAFVHIGQPWSFSGQQRVQAARLLVQSASDGLEQSLSYFYNYQSVMEGAPQQSYRNVDSLRLREMVTGMIAGLQAGEVKTVQEAAASLTEWDGERARTHPRQLLSITLKMLDPALNDLPPQMRERCKELAWLERWDDFRHWWEGTLELLRQAMRSGHGEGFRREVQLMRAMIRERYAEDLQVAELAHLVQLHPSYAGALFKSETGEHVSDYLNRIRMNKAKELLERTTMKIYEVSQAIGMTDYRYFCRVFKNDTGKTPTEYKKARHSPSSSGIQLEGE
ncbi:response regulator transcription factor [Paenibacillus chungangensis]|uniref:Response regulator n=1 Tax=Paenibacillus chungangensis TaxID=696535 RepID=A0ABW3HS28_9BACL